MLCSAICAYFRLKYSEIKIKQLYIYLPLLILRPLLSSYLPPTSSCLSHSPHSPLSQTCWCFYVLISNVCKYVRYAAISTKTRSSRIICSTCVCYIYICAMVRNVVALPSNLTHGLSSSTYLLVISIIFVLNCFSAKRVEPFCYNFHLLFRSRKR